MLEAVPVERDASSFHVVHAPAPAPHHDDDAHEEDQGRGEAVEEVEVGLARASSGHFASLCVGLWPSFRRLTRSVRAQGVCPLLYSLVRFVRQRSSIPRPANTPSV